MGYLDVRNLNRATENELANWLSTKQIYCHNSLFDYPFLKLWLGRRAPKLIGDTLVLYKLLTTEHLSGHTLDDGIQHVLGWQVNNKKVLEELLQKHSLTKSEMGKLADLEPDLFAWYCAMDSDACYQLNRALRTQAKSRHLEDTVWWYDTQYMNLENLIVEQRLRGVLVDREGVEDLQQVLRNDMRGLTAEFRNHPEVAPFLAQFEKEAGEKIVKTEGTRKIRARLSDEPWKHPDVWVQELRKPSSKWETTHGCWCRYEPTVKITHRKVPEVVFNVQSKAHLRELFYGHLGYKPTETTTTGLAKIDKAILPKLGRPGEILAQYNKTAKLEGYVTGLKEKLGEDDILHYNLRVHGTLTGRCSGTGGINIQQLPKDEEYLKCFKARPGHVLIDTDFTSLENVVLAEYSRDPGLLELYASGKPHDSYLFVACFLFPDSGLSEVYRPDNPTKESVAEAKSRFKNLRTVAKVITLASNYGAGAKKIWFTLTQAGHSIDLNEVYELHRKYWELFAGIKKFEQELLDEWEYREGYIFNGVGRALVIPDNYLKDIVNRFCQSTGVGLLHRLLWHIDKLRHEKKVPLFPWICDWHDECIFECEERYTEQAKQILWEAYGKLNEELNPLIPLKGDIVVAKNLWEAKNA